MSKRKGTVSRVGKGQYSYYIQLDDDGHYFNTKFEPKCGVGDVVGLEFTKKDEKRSNISKVVVLEKNSAGYEATASGGDSKASASGGGGGYTADPARQDSIVYQSSRKDALVFIGVLLGEAAFAVKGKPDAKREQLEELLDEITGRFFKDASNPKASNALTGDGADDDEGEEQNDSFDDDKKESGGKDEWASDDEWDD